MANYQRANSTLYDDDDVDDEYFLRRSNNYSNGGISSNLSDQWEHIDNRKAELLAKRLEIEEKTLKSTQRTLQHLRNSELVGVATAEELLHQREQLERTGKNLDEINSTLRFSQRHIQGIKSVFGGLKNLISGKPSMPAKKPSNVSEEASTTVINSRLSSALEKSSSSSALHPALALADKYVEPEHTLKSDPNNRQEILNDNMEHILDSVKKLKDLASGLGDEIDNQNEMIDTIIDKAERADRSLARQNKDINKILK